MKEVMEVGKEKDARTKEKRVKSKSKVSLFFKSKILRQFYVF